MPYLTEALKMLRSGDPSRVGRGELFERMMLAALRDHPGEYGPARFENLWLWNDWSGRDDRVHTGDIGIDLVGRQTPEYGGGLCAVQCKFYDTAKVSTADVNKFLADHGPRPQGWKSRIFVATSDYTGSARQKLEQAPNTEILTPAKLDAWPLDWRELVRSPEQADYVPVRYQPRPDQLRAVDAIVNGLATGGRGRVVMPCGTGKSVVALWAAERLTGLGGRVLYLVPSIALMDQVMREWAAQRSVRHRYLGVCSDAMVGRRAGDEGASIAELAMPVTTNTADVASELKREAPEALTVAFCTYQSLDKICRAQQLHGCPAFDLVICDEAHRSTGVDGSGLFTMVHNEARLAAERRLYMTATQRIYTDAAKSKADGDLYSMDDETQFGPLLYSMTFGEAIEENLLSNYEVLVVGVGEDVYGDLLGPSARNGVEITRADSKVFKLDYSDAVKLLGCWDALADPDTLAPSADRSVGEVTAGVGHCRTAIAFTNTVKASRDSAAALNDLTARAASNRGGGGSCLTLNADHVDGKMNAYQRSEKLQELRKAADDESAAVGGPGPRARLLSNARCLTEGVDVPALDAVVLLAPKRSDVDIVQAVGRVMRTAPAKSCGYVVLPVLVPAGELMHSREVIEGSDFKQVFRVLRALRSHDERLDVMVNSVSAARNLPLKVLDRTGSVDIDVAEPDGVGDEADGPVQQQLALSELLTAAIASAVVEQVGDRQYWPSWGRRTAGVCDQVRAHLDAMAAADSRVRDALEDFAQAIRRTSIPSFTEPQARAMVAQHVVTIPVFDAFFAESRFAEHNPVSQHLRSLLNRLAAAGVTFNHITEPLKSRYRQIAGAFRAADSDASSGERLEVLRQVYDGFLKAAMPAEVQRLGIVYTPIELVDFMLRSVDAVCRAHFGRGLTDEDVTVLDPFTGTGTFIARLFSITGPGGDPLIADVDVVRKYSKELYAREIVMLPYYIAALKIEESAAERGVYAERGYKAFPGIVLADTFESETPAMRRQRESHRQQAWAVGGLPAGNASRVMTQESTPIKVIVGNPPWSDGQDSSGDENPRPDYEEMAKRVKGTYGARHLEVTGTRAGGKSAGNLYVKAFRWATDRLTVDTGDPASEGWVVAFVTPNSMTTATSLAGMRAALRDEFSDIYVVNLRGDGYKSGEEARVEGDTIFSVGSRSSVQITVLVRNPGADPERVAVLRYAQVPDAATRTEKFAWLAELGDVTSSQLTEVPVTARHDWVNFGDSGFDQLMPVCDTSRNKGKVAVTENALGVATNCDAYVYSFSRDDLIARIRRLIDAYDSALSFVHSGRPDRATIRRRVEQATVNDRLAEIKWTHKFKATLRRGDEIIFDEARIREVLYRPFTKLWLYEDVRILAQPGASVDMFPRDERRAHDRGGGGASFSPAPPTRRSSERSRPVRSRTSAGPEPSRPAESYPESGDDSQSDAPDPVRDTRRGPPHRPLRDRTPDPGDALETSADETIIVASLSVTSPDSVIAADRLADLNVVGPNRGGGGGSWPASGPGLRDGQHDLSGSGDEGLGRSGRHRWVSPDQGSAVVAAIMIPTPSPRTRPAVLATDVLADLHSVDPACRVLPP